MSIVDNVDMENQIGEVVDAFEEKMKILFEEVPEMFEGRSTEQEWSTQVKNCGLDLMDAIGKVVEQYEAKLHNGEYYEELRDWQQDAGIKTGRTA
tara:strand:- start:1251 stop:1535 length:285 start_codon:yes stop_codon:yes gene_type:complete